MIGANFSKNILIYVWIGVMLIASIILCQTNYVSKSNDSRFYSEQVEKYYSRPWSEVLTPKWGVNYGFDPNSYMRDQFPGQMVMGVVGARMGIPAKHSLHIIEMFFQVFSILLLSKIVTKYFGEDHAIIINFGLLLIAPAFSHNLRANHESGIAFFSILALYSGINFRENKKINGALMIVSTFMLLFIKGPFLLFGFLLFKLGVFASYDFKIKNSFKVVGPYLMTVILCIIVNVYFIYWFENYFIKITGESFVKEFYRLQFVERALEVKDKYPFIIQKFFNFYYYFEHCLTYSLPWSLFALVLTISKLIRKVRIEFYSSKVSLIFIFASLIFCAVFATSNRLAGRYAFPAYYISSAWMIMFTYFNSSFLFDLVQRLSKKITIMIIIGLWFMEFLLPILSR